MNTCSQRLVIAAAVWLASAVPTFAAQLNVEDYRWNLDGIVRLSEFNQLAILVTNTSAEDFDGPFNYEYGAGVSKQYVLTQPLFLGKGQSTRVVFDVRFGEYPDDGTIRWGPRKDEQFGVTRPTDILSYVGLDEDDPKKIPPVVWIDSELGLAPQVGGSVRPITNRWFPITATSLPTDGVVALSDDPAFQPAQRQALADWVGLGGTIVVFKSGDSFDDFTGELAFLNVNADRRAVGRGLVIRDSRSVRDLNANDWRELSRLVPRGAYPVPENDGNYNDYGYANTRDPRHQFSDSVYQAMSIIHRPKVVWPLIFLMFFLYIGAVVGGGLFVSRKTRDWKATYATLGVLVGLFCGIFWYIGARGHGEESEAVTVAIVDVIGKGDTAQRARVRGWTQFFTTSSGTFDMNPVEGRLGLRPRDYNGDMRIFDGPDGALLRRVPVYSAASFEWQGITEINVPTVKSATWQDGREQIALDVENAGNAELYFLHNGKLGAVSRREKSIDDPSDGENDAVQRYVTSWSQINQVTALSPNVYSLTGSHQTNETRDEARERVFDTADEWIRQVGQFGQEGQLGNQDDAGVLLIVDDLPDELATRYSEGAVHRGRVLYRIGVQIDNPQSAQAASPTTSSESLASTTLAD